MSLVAFALRIATVRLLRAALPAAFRVIDSPVDTIDLLANDPTAALVAIYAGRTENRMDGNGFFEGDPTLDLEMQIIIPTKMTFGYTTAGVTTQLALDTRAEGSATALDFIARMILRAIATRPAPWGVLWGRFVTQVHEMAEASYLIETQKTKFVANEIRMRLDTLREPVPGVAAAGIWADLLTAMAADTETDSVAALAPWLAAEINLPLGLAQTEIDRIRLGIGADAQGATGIGPLAELDEKAGDMQYVPPPDGEVLTISATQ